MRRKTAIAIALCLLLVWAMPAGAAVEILNVRHWAAPDHTRIVIDTSEEARYRYERDGQKIAFFFSGAVLGGDLPAEMSLNKPGIERIALRQGDAETVQMDFFLTGQGDVKIFQLKRFQDKPERVVFDIRFPDLEKKASEEREQVKVAHKERIVVIDPGHGGDDPGAIGPGGTYEKDVVLEIGRRLKTLLNETPGFRAFLTRDGDYYVPFRQRLQIAREYGSDLFISIHANAAPSRKVRGSAVYALSMRGATTEAARLLANKENLADLVGGFVNGTPGPHESSAILLNMCQTSTMNQSKVFGKRLLRHLGRVSPLQYRRVQEAPFRVLKLPDIPAILVETAFLSNPKEERRLRSDAFQRDIALAIAGAVQDFLPLEWPRQPRTLQVQKGGGIPPPARIPPPPPEETKRLEETLAAASPPPADKGRDAPEGIPAPSLGAGQAAPPAAAIRVASRVQVEPAKRPKTSASHQEGAAQKTLAVSSRLSGDAPVYYRVKRGDSLSKIAAAHETTVARLVEWNGLQPHRPLYVDRRLIVARPNRTIARGDERREARKAAPPQTLAAGRPGAREKTPAVSSRPSGETPVYYRVKRGDSLSKIAAAHETTVARLVEWNGLQPHRPLYVDRRLIVARPNRTIAQEDEEHRLIMAGIALSSATRPPGGRGKERAGEAPVLYRVKPGDTLEKIARRHATTIATLLRLNGMKIEDPLYSDRKIRLPRQDAL